MIICKRCEFEVDASMRHSLVKNCCPSCGAALLGDLYMRRFQLLKEKILEQEFSQELSSDLIFDVTLFMLTEFFPGKPQEGDVQEDDVQEGDVQEGDVQEDALQRTVLYEETEDSAAESYNNIRDEVRSEMLSKMADDIGDADTDLKVARLKRIAKEKAVNSPGATVRRVSD